MNWIRERQPVDDRLGDVAERLRPQTILLDVEARDQRHALGIAAAAIAASHGLGATLVFDALWRREQVGSTALGESFAIPHARVGRLTQPVTLFLRTAVPIAFDAPDGMPVSNLLVIMVPSDGESDEHLTMLAVVARLISTRRFRKHLRVSQTPDEVAEAFRVGIDRAVVASR